MNTDELIMCKDILSLLHQCKEEIFEIFHKHGYDSAYYDVTIDLRVQIDEVNLNIKEKWESLSKVE